MSRRYLTWLICTFFIIGACVCTVQATILGFDTHSLSDEEKSAIIEKIDLKAVQDDSYKVGIQCFDVSQDGMIALALGSGSNCRIYVYNTAGIFQYGYQFCSDGDYGIKFHGETLAIYFIRGNTIAVYDSTGVCVDVQKVINTNQSNMQIKKILNQPIKETTDKKYLLERDVDIGDSYSKFSVIDKQGQKRTLYDISTEHTIGQIARLVVAIGFFTVVVWGIYKKQKVDKET